MYQIHNVRRRLLSVRRTELEVKTVEIGPVDDPIEIEEKHLPM
jgi:hypothetical protein